MKRTTLSFIIDAVAFAAFLFLATTGILMRYILPPGSGRLEGMGAGVGAAGKPVTLLWGLTRHQWGTVHFWIAVTLMAVLALHLIRHWRWIACVVQGRPREGSGARVAFGIFGLVGLMVVAIAPLLAPTEQFARSDLVRQPTTATATPEVPRTVAPQTPPDSRSAQVENTEDLVIRGSMTLREIEQTTGVPVSYLTHQLNLPENTSPDAQLGQLRRRYGFEIETVRRFVAAYEKPSDVQ